MASDHRMGKEMIQVTSASNTELLTDFHSYFLLSAEFWCPNSPKRAGVEGGRIFISQNPVALSCNTPHLYSPTPDQKHLTGLWTKSKQARFYFIMLLKYQELSPTATISILTWNTYRKTRGGKVYLERLKSSWNYLKATGWISSWN